MKNILFIIAISLAPSVTAQILNDILDGKRDPRDHSELSQTVLLTMAPQNGIPNEVVVFKIEDFDCDSLFQYGMNPQLSNDIKVYASIGGDDNVLLPLYEEGVYSIVCLDENDNYVGEGVSIVVNENFINSIIETGFAENRDGLVVSTKPLHIGRDKSEFVCFN